MGIDIGSPQLNISSLFFADDMAVVAKSKDALNTLLGIVRKYFDSHKLQISTTKTKIMTYEASTGNTVFNGSETLSPISFEAVLSLKIAHPYRPQPPDEKVIILNLVLDGYFIV